MQQFKDRGLIVIFADCKPIVGFKEDDFSTNNLYSEFIKIKIGSPKYYFNSE